MQSRYRRITDFNCQVAARDHDAIAIFHDVGERFVGDGFGALDFCDQQGVAARRAHELPRHVHVGTALGEGHREEVGTNGHRRLDVVHIFGGERGGGEAAAFAVDAFIVGEHATHLHQTFDAVAAHRFHFKYDQAIVEQ